MTLTKKITTLFAITLFFASGVFAQPKKEISDKEIEQFASAVQEVAAINQQTQQKMVNTVEEEGLAVQRFNEIIQSQQDPNKETELKDGEKKKFENVNRRLEEMQVKAQSKMEEKIIDEGLTLKRYQEIATLVQNDPDLQQRIKEILQPAG